MSPEHFRYLFHQFQTGSHVATAPGIQKPALNGDVGGDPELLEVLAKEGMPGPVDRLRSEVRTADGLLLAQALGPLEKGPPASVQKVAFFAITFK